ncbi:MAG: hypothetical protein ACEQSH_00365 [Bacteroidia bacterium]
MEYPEGPAADGALGAVVGSRIRYRIRHRPSGEDRVLSNFGVDSRDNAVNVLKLIKAVADAAANALPLPPSVLDALYLVLSDADMTEALASLHAIGGVDAAMALMDAEPDKPESPRVVQAWSEGEWFAALDNHGRLFHLADGGKVWKPFPALPPVVTP